MIDIKEFGKALADPQLTFKDRAIALLWYYRETQEYDERSASDLSKDLHELGFPRQNVTRLSEDLKNSRIVIKGKRKGTLQIDVRKTEELDKKYGPIIGSRKRNVSDSIIPKEMITSTRKYIEKMVYEINGSYEYEMFDACATMCRRLMESLIIDIYFSRNRQNEIISGGSIFPLEKLIAFLKNDTKIHLSRTMPKTMDMIKELGDTAAHDRTYITQQVDIDDIKQKYRKLLNELLTLSGVN